MQSIDTNCISIYKHTQYFDLPVDCHYHSYWQNIQNTAVKSGASSVIGPIDRDTWHRYRTVIADTGAPAFMLEPYNSDWREYVDSGLKAGFDITSTYATSVCNLKEDGPSLNYPEFGELTFKPFDMDCFDQQLNDIFQLSCQSFVHNYLYKAIDWSEFLALYQPVKPLMAKLPALTELVYRDGQLVGLCLVLLDGMDQSGKGAILKTLMRQNDHALKGLGLTLVSRAIERSKRLGFEQLLLALYKEDGMSAYIANLVNASVIRRYGLLAKTICQGESI